MKRKRQSGYSSMILMNFAVWVAKRILEIPRRGLPSSGRRYVFDEERGTRTDGVVWFTCPSSKCFMGGVRYEPCSPSLCRWSIDNSGVDPKAFLFLDIGCGKGRPLIIASDYEFRMVIGIDYSLRLCRIARQNLVRCHARNALVICADATEFVYPSVDTFAFLYHPFSNERLLKFVLNELRDATRGHKLVIAYLGVGRSVLSGLEWLSKYHESGGIALFRSISSDC